MLNSDLDIEQISRLMISNPRSEDIIRTSKALCVLGDEDVTAPSDIPEYIVNRVCYTLYSLKPVIEIFHKGWGLSLTACLPKR